MFTYNKENQYIYRFQTTKGSKYTIGFRISSMDSSEVGIMRDSDEKESANTVYEVMETVAGIINEYLKEHKLVKNILFTVEGEDADDINKKSVLYTRYINRFQQDYPDHSVNFNRL